MSRPVSPRPLVHQKQSSPRPSPTSTTPNQASDIPPPIPSIPLKSILASPPTRTPPAWLGSSVVESGAPPQLSASKRKHDANESDDPHSKIRRIVREPASQDPGRVMAMTTVICLHAAVAQKSYGSEKRFLCPPPVVHIEGPLYHMRRQDLSMTVVSEIGERSFDQKAPLDSNMTASFKFLHVTGTAKAKSFQLSLEIADPPAASPTEGAEAAPGRAWATFDSAPVTIISKPSKKTAKTRNISSCILAGGPVSLFNRINSQTVRTKYMTIDHAQLCASNVTWSAFNVNVVPRANDPPSIGGPQPVTYGCSIILSDSLSGISTSPLIIRKVDKGRVSNEDGGPVSQMQKIALQRVNADGTRHYLSAAGPLPGTQGVIAPPAPGASSQAGSHPLLFQSPRIRDETKDGVRVLSDDVDDYLCWTIVGISKFQYTFFDAFGQNNSIPEMPITPFPTLFTAPVYRQNNNTLELTVANFFYDEPNGRQQMPLDVYLGNLGPLPHRVYQTSPPGPLTTVSPFVNRTSDGADASPHSPTSPMAPRFAPGPVHAIVIVELPAIAVILKALEDEPNPSEPAARASASNGSSAIAGRSLPLLFIRPIDGVGYHSGRTVTCENLFHSMDISGGIPSNPPANVDNSWLAAAAAENNLQGWTLRLM